MSSGKDVVLQDAVSCGLSYYLHNKTNRKLEVLSQKVESTINNNRLYQLSHNQLNKLVLNKEVEY